MIYFFGLLYFLIMFIFNNIQKYTVSFAKVVKTLNSIELQSSRINKKTILQSFIKSLSKQDVIHLQNFFKFASTTFSRLSDKSIQNYLIKQKQVNESKIKAELARVNDVPTMASILYPITDQLFIGKQLQLSQIITSFEQLKAINGVGSIQSKYKTLDNILYYCRNQDEIKFIIRVLLRDLNIGMNEKSFTPLFNNFEQSTQIKYRPMVAKPLKSFEEVKIFSTKNHKGTISAEIKYDGERTMIYYKKGKQIKFISRNRKSQQDSFPDLIQKVKNQLDKFESLTQCILDGQIICIKKQDQRPTAIQTLMSRKGTKRKLALDSSFQQKIMIFDILSYNDQSLINQSFTQRVAHIPLFDKSSLLTRGSKIDIKLPQEEEKLKIFFQQTIKQGYQGLIIKCTETVYDIKDSRKDWAKLKKDCLLNSHNYKGLELDLILMGAYRRKVKDNNDEVYGSFLVGTIHNGVVHPLCKVGTGMNEQQLKFLSDIANSCKTDIAKIPIDYKVSEKLDPDIWCNPKFVFEIQCQQFTRSPLYSFGKSKNEGISLRFPKFIRLRDDKSLEQATTGEEILSMMQQSNE